MRQRDERFAGQEKYKAAPDPLHDKSGKKTAGKPNRIYHPKDFCYDPATQTCIFPAGKILYGNGSGCVINGFSAIKFQGAQRERALRTSRSLPAYAAEDQGLTGIILSVKESQSNSYRALRFGII